MGRLYDTVQRIEAGPPVFRRRGLVASGVGFSLGFVTGETPDDGARIAAPRAAAREVLGEPIA